MAKVSSSRLGIVVVVQRNGKNMRALETSVQRRGSKSRSSLQRAEMVYYVTQSPRGHELSLDILARGQS